MLYYYGHYLLLSYTIQSPKGFSLSLANVRMDFINHEQLNFEFYLQSNGDDKNACENIIMACEQALGFSLDRSVSASWSLSPQRHNNELPPDNYSEKNIPFVLVHHTIDIKTLQPIAVPYQFNVSRSELENLVLTLSQDNVLSNATFYYLKAIDEPDQYLALLYKAYETIRHTKVIPKKQASRFGKIANDDEVVFSRHVKPSSNLHGLTPEEDDFCRQTIRNGILKYVESLR
jgi:hypothetical protein